MQPKRWFAISLYLVSLCLSCAHANSPLRAEDETFHALVDQGLCFINTGHYQQALETCRELIRRYPESPVGYFHLAGAYQVMMRNYRVKSLEDEFERSIALAIKKGEQSTHTNSDDTLSYLYLGGAYGYRALHKIRRHEWFGAFRDGRRSISRLEKAIEADPTLYDTYYGLGTYHYWRSAKARVFWFLPFIGDDRQQGIDELWRSIYQGRHSEIEGKYALVAIYYNEGNWERAFTLNQQLFEQFPENPSCLYMRGRILEQQAQWEQMEETFRQLLDHVTASEYRSIGYQMECHYRIALALSQQKQCREALEACEMALQLSTFRKPSQELEGPLEGAKEIVEATRELRERLVRMSDTYSGSTLIHGW